MLALRCYSLLGQWITDALIALSVATDTNDCFHLHVAIHTTRKCLLIISAKELGNVIASARLFVCLFVSEENYAKNFQAIFMEPCSIAGNFFFGGGTY